MPTIQAGVPPKVVLLVGLAVGRVRVRPKSVEVSGECRGRLYAAIWRGKLAAPSSNRATARYSLDKPGAVW